MMRRFLHWWLIFAAVLGSIVQCTNPTDLDVPRYRWIEPAVPMAVELLQYDIATVPPVADSSSWQIHFLKQPVLDTLATPAVFATTLFAEVADADSALAEGRYRFHRFQLVLDSIEVVPQKLMLGSDPDQKNHVLFWFQTINRRQLTTVPIPVDSVTLRIYPVAQKHQVGLELHTFFTLPDSSEFMLNAFFLFGPRK